ncbi:MAG: hypothetical protein KGZ74_14265 [Chitinophagaceae bacterium]|nr:hypothetical protein [Chitinophagaceae bacterium]
MHKKDYIQRQFEEFGKVLSVLLTFKKNRDWEAFEKKAQEAANSFTHLDLEKTENLSEEEFDVQLIKTPALTYDQKKILANLLFEKMNSYDERGYPEKYDATKAKCRVIYSALKNDLTQHEYDLDVHYKLELLRK